MADTIYTVKMTDNDPSKGPFKLIETAYHAKGKSPQYRIATEMALAHNAYIRSINAIYLQSLSVPKSSIPDFLTYCQCWYEAVHHHHDLEEDFFFPGLEAETGVKGLMSVNMEQHKAFHGKLEEWGESAYRLKAEEFDGEEWRRGIEAFAGDLVKHLHEEIPTLVDLCRHNEDGSKIIPLWERFDAKIVAESDKFRLFPLVLGARDSTYENSMHAWPAIPFFVPYLVDYIFARRHRGAWRFAPSDVYGQPRPLQFVDGGKK